MRIKFVVALMVFNWLVVACGAFPINPARAGERFPSPRARTPKSTDLLLASGTLNTFFAYLNVGRYQEAIAYYGGTYESLIADNPSTDPQDHAAFLRDACTMNGYQCLQVKEIVQTEELATDTWKFTVEFLGADGKLFVRGPCCGATETQMPSISRFDYTVKKAGDSFLVQELPVYVP